MQLLSEQIQFQDSGTLEIQYKKNKKKKKKSKQHRIDKPGSAAKCGLGHLDCLNNSVQATSAVLHRTAAFVYFYVLGHIICVSFHYTGFLYLLDIKGYQNKLLAKCPMLL